MSRHFTRQEVEELRAQLTTDAVRDSDLAPTESMTGDDWVAIVQNGLNRKININVFRDLLQNGPQGDSAYEVAVRHGYEGTEEEWLNDPNGIKGVGIETWETEQSDVDSGITTITVTFNTGEQQVFMIHNGKGIVSVETVGEPSSEDSAVNTYRITFSDESEPFEFDVKNGKGITSASIIGSYNPAAGAENTYRLTFSDNTYFDFVVKNANGISSVVQTASPSGSGETNNIRVYMSDGNTFDFQVKNGLQGESGITGDVSALVIVNDLNTNDSSKPLASGMGKLLNETKLGWVSEQIDVQENPSNYYNKSETDSAISTAVAPKVNTADIVDNLTTNDATKPLSAKQGKALRDNLSQLGQEVEWIPKEEHRGYINHADSQNPYWADIDTGSRFYKILDVHNIKGKITMKAPSEYSSECFFLSSYNGTPSQGGNTGIISSFICNANIEDSTDIPEGTQYLYLLSTTYSNNRIPVKLIVNDTINLLELPKLSAFNNYNYTNSVENKVQVLSEKTNVFEYCIGGGSPQFSFNSDQTFKVTFPYNIRLYKNDGGILYDNISVSGQNYSIPILNKLVYDLADSTVKVVAVDTTGNYIVLLSNIGASINGLLLPYLVRYLNSQSNLFAYFASNKEPDIVLSITGENAVGLTITLPSANLVVYSLDGIKFIETNTLAGTYTVANNKVLVYDLYDSSIKTITIGTTGNFIELISNYLGTVSGLLAKYYYRSMFGAATEKSITVANGSKFRGFVRECYLYGNIDKTKKYYVSLVYHHYSANTRNVIRISSSSVASGVCEYSENNVTSDNYGIIYLNEKNSSGIYGYIIVNWNILPNDGFSNLNIEFSEQVFELKCNSTIYTYLQISPENNTIEHLYNTPDFKEKVLNWQRGNRGLNPGTPTLKFLHLSDIHKTAVNVQRALELRNIYSSYIDDVINTGDDVNYYADGITSLVAINGWENILAVIGNHDTRGSGDDVNNWEKYAGADAYARYIGPYISNWGVTHDGNTSHCYYYKDYTSAGFRLIVLDNMVMPTASDHYDSNQITWFQSTLADAITQELGVICAWHCPGTLVRDTTNTFCSLDYNGNGWNGMDVFFDAIDTFIGNGGEFVCWITGHMHYDLFGVKEGHTNQTVIGVPCTWVENDNPDMQRELNTKTQDCFNLIAFDKNVKTIKVIRVGAEYDRYLRHKGVMCYNYATRELVFND